MAKKANRVYQELENTSGHWELLKHIAIYPDAVLAQKAVDFTPEELERGDHQKMAEVMFKVMYHFGGIGLAANQANFLKRIFAMDINDESRYGTINSFICTDAITGECIPPHKMVIINPQILEFSEDTDKFEEGCLSLPQIRVPVTRPKKIKIRFLDENLNEKTYYMESMLSKCAQHENDHLNGIMIVDKISKETRRFCYAKKLQGLGDLERCTSEQS